MSDQPKRVGRPPKAPGKGKRRNYTFRMSDQTRDRVIVAAEASGRSMSEMLERIVDLHFGASDTRTIVREEIAAEFDRRTRHAGYGKPPSVSDCIEFIERVGVENIPVLLVKRDH